MEQVCFTVKFHKFGLYFAENLSLVEKITNIFISNLT